MQRLVGTKSKNIFKMVRMKGVEPIRLAALDPKSSASANSATSALKIKNSQHAYSITKAQDCQSAQLPERETFRRSPRIRSSTHKTTLLPSETKEYPPFLPSSLPLFVFSSCFHFKFEKQAIKKGSP